MQPIPLGDTKVPKIITENRGFKSPKTMLSNKTHGLGQIIPTGTPQIIPIGETNIPFVQMETVNSNSIHLTPHNASYDLPTILLANLQSVGIGGENDKSHELGKILELNNIDIACLTETWLSESNEDQMHLENYYCFNLVRKDVRRASGGVSILVKEGVPTINLNIKVPEHIECLWLALRPKKLPRSISMIIVACLYYPGTTSDYAPSQEDIIFHLTETVHHLSDEYTKPLFLIMGDLNDLKTEEICDTCKLHQIVNVHTRNNATLDKISTNTNNEF